MAKTLRKYVVEFVTKADDKALKKFKNGVKSTLTSVAKLTAGAAVAGAAFVKMAQDTANAGDRAAKAAARFGITAEELQELEHAAELSGAGMTDLETAFRRQADLARQFNEGNKTAAKTLRTLGVNVRGSNGELKDQNTLFNELVGGLSKVENSTKRVALANQVFGRSGAKLLPLINAGADGLAKMRADAHALGAVISNDAAKQAEAFNDSLFRLKRTGEGLRNIIGMALIPRITDMANRMTAWFVANRKVISQKVEVTAEKVAKGITRMAKAAAKIDAFIEKIGGYERIVQVVGSLVTAFLGFTTIQRIIVLVTTLKAGFVAVASVGAVALAKIIAVALAVAAAIGLVVAVVQDVITYFRGGDSATGRLIARFKEFIESNTALKNALELVQRVGEKFLSLVMRIGKVIWDAIGPPVMEFITDGLEMLGGVFARVFTTIWESVIKPFGGMLFETFTNVFDLIETGLDALDKNWDGTLEGLETAFLAAFDAIFGKLRDFPNEAAKAAKDAVRKVSEAAGNAFDFFGGNDGGGTPPRRPPRGPRPSIRPGRGGGRGGITINQNGDRSTNVTTAPGASAAAIAQAGRREQERQRQEDYLAAYSVFEGAHDERFANHSAR